MHDTVGEQLAVPTQLDSYSSVSTNGKARGRCRVGALRVEELQTSLWGFQQPGGWNKSATNQVEDVQSDRLLCASIGTSVTILGRDGKGRKVNDTAERAEAVVSFPNCMDNRLFGSYFRVNKSKTICRINPHEMSQKMVRRRAECVAV